MASSPPRSLADDLRARSDEALAEVLVARPDLVHPVPADLTALATRAGSPGSVAAALRALDQLSLHVVLAAALARDPMSTTDLVAHMVEPLSPGLPRSQARDRVRAIVAHLRRIALLWGPERGLHLVGAARDLLVPADRGPRIAALDPVVAGYVADPESLHSLLAEAPVGARAALDRLLAGTLVGTVTDARRPPEPGRSPVDWLLAHHLLVPLGADRAVVPGEVAALLRSSGDTPAQELHPPALIPPAPAAPPVEAARVEAGSVGAVLEVLHGLSELGEAWTDDPPTRLRAGGIAQRDLTRTARVLGVAEATTALLIEVGAAAGLLAPDNREVITVLPTPGFDAWLAREPAERYAHLLTAWLTMPRRVAASAGRPLDPEGAAPGMAALRREVLAILAGAVGAWTDDEVVSAVLWWSPRRFEPDRAGLVREILGEMRALGLLVAGSLTPAGHGLLTGDDAATVAALSRALPGQVEALVLQADLTAVVPGLPSPDLAAFMRSVADPESTGAASVYRFSTGSVRRALDSGRTAADLLAELGRRGQVPQPLAYLIEDVARRHASLRIGAAATYLRCDDPALLAGILADPGTAALGLIALSDTVLVSDQPPEHVLDRLRQRGHHPLPEASIPTPGPRRARPRPATEPPPGVTPVLASAAVRAMRASDPATRVPAGAGRSEGRRPRGRGSTGTGAAGGRGSTGTGAAGGPPPPIPGGSPAEVVAALRAAISAETTVWIGYADPSGVAGERRVEPLRLAGGYLTALDLRSESVQSFAVARIAGVQPG